MAVAGALVAVPTSGAERGALLGKGVAADPQLVALTEPLVAPSATLDLNVIAELFGNADLSAAITALVNGMAAGGAGALLGWDDAVQIGADLVAALALAPAQGGVALDAGLVQALTAALAALNALAGPIGTPLLDGTATAAADLAAFLNAGMTDLAAAVGWKAQLDAVLADLVAAGGTDLAGGLSAALLGLPNGGPVALPDFAATAAALAAVINHVALGLDTGLLDWADVVNLGADVVGAVAQLPAALGGSLNAELTATVLAGLDAQVPVIGPLPTGIADAVTSLSGALDTAIALPGQAVAWKAGLDGVLADLVATGGAALTNDVAADLMGAVGAVPVGLPDIGDAEVNASVTAVVDHVTVGLAGVFLGDPAANAVQSGPAGSEVTAALVDNAQTLTSPDPTSAQIAGESPKAAATVTPPQQRAAAAPTAEKGTKSVAHRGKHGRTGG